MNDSPETITLLFCGQPGCAHQVVFREIPPPLGTPFSPPAYQCPMHGLAVGELRRTTYRREDLVPTGESSR